MLKERGSILKLVGKDTLSNSDETGLLVGHKPGEG
jgi:hypothetical protein